MNNGFNHTNTNPLMQNQPPHPQYNTFSDPNAGAPRHDIENGMGGQSGLPPAKPGMGQLPLNPVQPQMGQQQMGQGQLPLNDAQRQDPKYEYVDWNSLQQNGGAQMFSYGNSTAPQDYPDMDEPQYTGEKDGEDLPHGKGKMTFVDKSTYEGEFMHGLPHGEGFFKSEMHSFQGGWKTGMKHGKGLMTYPNGEKIDASWEDGKINGEGDVISKSGTRKPAIWHHDIMIPLGDQGRGCCDRAICNLILVGISYSLLFFGFLAKSQYNSDCAKPRFSGQSQSGCSKSDEQRYQALFAVGALCYLIQLCESIGCCRSAMYSYISNMEPLSHIAKHIHQVRMSRPIIKFTIQNYHYETRFKTEHYTDNNGNRRTRQKTERVRVNTHYASQHFFYNQWTDTSADPASLQYLEELKLTRLKFYKIFNFSIYANYSFNSQKSNFLHHNIRDQQYDFHVKKDIPGYKEHVLVYNDQKGPMPWFLNKCTYIGFTFLGLSWFLRILFVNASTKVRYRYFKLILN